MDPNSDKYPGQSLPRPTPESEPGGIERAAIPEAATAPPVPPAIQPMAAPAPAAPLPAAGRQTSVQGAPGVATPPAPAIADDNDLIEKEWVLKAKQIVERTKQDPYAQSSGLTRYKAEYMKKRYNKDIKIPEE